MIGLPVVFAATAQPAQSPAGAARGCVAPPGSTFEARGPRSGPLRLSLSLPASVRRGEPLVATLRLESDLSVVLLTNDNPFGMDYDVTITDASTGREVPKRDDYVPIITRISNEPVSRGCPAYQSLSLVRAYDVPVGSFIVQATRRPTQIVPGIYHPEVKKLPVLRSNAVTLTVY